MPVTKEMELSKNYLPTEIEAKWYKHWLDKKYFNSKPDNREAYTIVMPPPNVTGVLHMGHCLNNTIQDILIRRARMQGKNACWVPGTDHASIATEAKVVQMLRERGITKSSLSRDEFLSYAWEWKEKYGGIILEQLKKLGCSLDWDRTTFTMDGDYYNSVIKVFIDLYNKGLIYRGKRMINWDVRAKTALSDEEVIHKEVAGKLYYIKYFIDGDADSFITVATVRPETIMGDTAVCVNPNDERYAHLHGKFVYVPLINRRIPIITDEYVTTDFGTGALKVTPAHDINDYQLAQKHGLEVIDIMNDDGTLNASAQLYIGEDRMDVRKKIVKILEEENFLTKTEDYTNQVGFSERTDAIVEPRLSLQWWVSMKKISEPALRTVMDEEIKFYPPKFKNTYRHWMENIKDWCISRQLWWGHRIPAWYDNEGRFVVAETKEEAFEKFKIQHPTSKIEDIRQDEDCLDTWFSSWLWPFEVFKGLSHPGNEDVKYYYPTNTLVTAPEIIFFWVARMIMAGFEYMDQKPFSEVYFTGIVRDKQGRKMSKSLGNSPDLLGLIDKYGADAVRFGIMISSPAGNDLLFDESSLEQGRNFNNKLWNALKLIKIWEKDQVEIDNITNHFAITWFERKLYDSKIILTQLLDDFRLSEALKILYSLIWDDFCSYYLERIKPEFEQKINSNFYRKTIALFSELLELLHPYMPFITEEIYHLLEEKKDDLSIKVFNLDLEILPISAGVELTEICRKLSTKIAEFRNKKGVKKDTQLEIVLVDFPFNEDEITVRLKKDNAIAKTRLTNVSEDFGEKEFEIFANKNQFELVIIDEFKFFINLNQIYKRMEASVVKQQQQQRKKELEDDLEHQKGFLQSVLKKLSNERFVQNAKPEILALEQKKQADAEARIKTIEESLSALN